jgi:carboxymethylenebutenolidase
MEGLWELSLEERRDKTPSFRDALLERALSALKAAQAKFAGVTTLGFCMGVSRSLKCAARNRSLRSAVSFYGQSPSAEDVVRISVPVLDIHAFQDELINKGVPAFVGAMLEGGKDLMLKTYPGTKHGFFNDTRREVYDRDAANEAWDLTRWFLEKTLGRH